MTDKNASLALAAVEMAKLQYSPGKNESIETEGLKKVILSNYRWLTALAAIDGTYSQTYAEDFLKQHWKP